MLSLVLPELKLCYHSQLLKPSMQENSEQLSSSKCLCNNMLGKLANCHLTGRGILYHLVSDTETRRHVVAHWAERWVVNPVVANSTLHFPLQGCILTWKPQDLAHPGRAYVTLINKAN